MTGSVLPSNPEEARDCMRHPGLCFVCPYHTDDLTDCKGRVILARVRGLVSAKKHPGRMAEIGRKYKSGGRPRKPDSELKRPRRRPKAGEATPAAAPVIALEMRQEPAEDAPEL